MGKNKNKAYSLRLDEEIMNKIRAIAEKEDRPLSKQFERITKDYIENYEKKNGSINVEIHDNKHIENINIRQTQLDEEPAQHNCKTNQSSSFENVRQMQTKKLLIKLSGVRFPGVSLLKKTSQMLIK